MRVWEIGTFILLLRILQNLIIRTNMSELVRCHHTSQQLLRMISPSLQHYFIVHFFVDINWVLFQSTVQFTSFEPVGEALASSTSTVSCSTVISPVDIFIANVKRVSDDLEPLIEWTHNFTVSKNPDDIRQVIQICQVIDLSRCVRSSMLLRIPVSNAQRSMWHSSSTLPPCMF